MSLLNSLYLQRGHLSGKAFRASLVICGGVFSDTSTSIVPPNSSGQLCSEVALACAVFKALNPEVVCFLHLEKYASIRTISDYIMTS